jgi:hypothetical protein
MTSAARSLIMGIYDLSTAIQSPAEVRRKATALVDGQNFIVRKKFNPRKNQEENAYFGHPGLWDFLQTFLFHGYGKIGRHEAVSHYFRPIINPTTIWLAATALQCAIQSLTITGYPPKPPPMFEAETYSLAYNKLSKTWNKACNPAFWRRLLC